MRKYTHQADPTALPSCWKLPVLGESEKQGRRSSRAWRQEVGRQATFLLGRKPKAILKVQAYTQTAKECCDMPRRLAAACTSEPLLPALGPCAAAVAALAL